MSILVTGGAGFIGSHTVDELVKNDFDVVIVDNMSNGKERNINQEAEFYQLDLLDKTKLSQVFEGEKPSSVIHLAAQISLRHSLENPIHDAEQNILSTLNLLECCREFGTEKIVYSSSSAVYGFPKYLPVDEEHPIMPFAPYGASKRIVEHYLYAYSQNFGIDYNVLRYANVFGERQDPQGEAGVIAIFLDALRKDKRPVIFGNGEQTRDFVYVKDVAKANILALNKETKSKLFNISSNKEVSVNELLDILASSLKTDTKPIHEEPLKEVKRVCFDNKLARKELNWKHEMEFNKAIKRMVLS